MTRRLRMVAVCGLLVWAGSACGSDGDEDTREPLTIIPIGDSITQSFETGTYRCYLDQLLHEAGVAFDFVGSMSPELERYDCPTDFDVDHEAVPGSTIDARRDAAITSVLRMKPDVALVHLGSNDVALGFDRGVRAIADDLADLVQELQAAHPDITILVAQVIPCSRATSYCTDGIPSYNELVASFAELSTDRSTVVVVDMFTGFDVADLPDGIHPDVAGEQAMARRWMSALQQAGIVDV